MSRVEVVVAVHSPARPVGRAVASVLDGNGTQAAVTVVCHDVPGEEVAAVLRPQDRGRVRLLEHADGVRSASGPFNAGMRAARGEFVSLLGSDDTLQPGAVDSWLALTGATGAETVLTRLALGRPTRRVPTPPTRPWLRGPADAVRDRLSYRSAPLGLVSVAARERTGAELVEGMPVGGDVPYVTRLWVETRVAVDRRGPAYVIGEDAADRVTYAPRPIAVELGFLTHLLGRPWFAGYDEAVRSAVVTKLVRIHLFGAVWHRPDPLWWDHAERTALRTVADGLLASAPGAARPLSLADRALLDACLDPSVPAAELLRRAAARRRHGRPGTLLPREPAALLHREAPLRFMAASLLSSR